MNKSIAKTAALVAALIAAQIVPAWASQLRRHYHGKYMAASGMSIQPSIALIPDAKPLSPIAQDAEEAIIWQNSLHGENN